MLVRFFAGAAEAAGTDSMEVNAADLDLAGLIHQLGAENEDLARVVARCSCLADGMRICLLYTSPSPRDS